MDRTGGWLGLNGNSRMRRIAEMKMGGAEDDWDRNGGWMEVIVKKRRMTGMEIAGGGG